MEKISSFDISSFSIVLIIVLVLASGVIAYLGDLLGHRIGKRRIKLFGLRPKTTAKIVTVFIGISIMLVTFVVLVTFSKEARIAIFEMDKYTAQLKSLKSLMASYEVEIKELARKAAKLRMELAAQRSQQVIVTRFDLLGYVYLPAGLSYVERLRRVEKAVELILNTLESDGVIVRASRNKIREEVEKLKISIADKSTSLIVAMIALENVVKGSELGKVSFIVVENKVVFRKGEELLKEHPIEFSVEDRDSFFDKIRDIKDKLEELARRRYVVASPAVVLELSEIAKLINALEEYGKVKVWFKVLEDSDRLHPVKVGVVWKASGGK